MTIVRNRDIVSLSTSEDCLYAKIATSELWHKVSCEHVLDALTNPTPDFKWKIVKKISWNWLVPIHVDTTKWERRAERQRRQA